MNNLMRRWNEIGNKKEDFLDAKRVKIASDISIEVYKILKEKNMKRVDLAKEMGVSRSLISQILSADANLRLSTLIKISEALGVDLEVSFSSKKDELEDEKEVSFDLVVEPSFAYKVFQPYFEKNPTTRETSYTADSNESVVLLYNEIEDENCPENITEDVI